MSFNSLTVGIDKISFYTSSYMLDLGVLAAARGIDPDKFYLGLGQRYMAVPSPDEDVVTMGANAAKQVLEGVNCDQIAMFLFATESSFDQAKSAGIYLHNLLGLNSACRVVEIKQACYAGTFGLQLAMPFLRENPHKKVLLIAADIARYGLNTPGEPSQGCGAVAMLLSINPRILVLENESGICAENVMDFWRPNYLDFALVDGKYSSKIYLNMLTTTWERYVAQSKRDFFAHSYYCYHTPLARLAEKAQICLHKFATNQQLPSDEVLKKVVSGLQYIREIGNCYTASLYLAFISLLDNAQEDLGSHRVGFYSYGSGCVAEFFSGVVQQGYRELLNTNANCQLLANRHKLSYAEYNEFYNFSYPTNGGSLMLARYTTGDFRLAGLSAHKRIYESTSSR